MAWDSSVPVLAQHHQRNILRKDLGTLTGIYQQIFPYK